MNSSDKKKLRPKSLTLTINLSDRYLKVQKLVDLKVQVGAKKEKIKMITRTTTTKRQKSKSHTTQTQSNLSSDKTPTSSKDTNCNLLTYNEIPAWYQDNEFILTGYRPVSKCYNRSAQSIFSCHNETFNIWSHLLFTAPTLLVGCCYFLQFYQNLFQKTTNYSSLNSPNLPILKNYAPWAMAFFYLSASSMFCCSSIFHLSLHFRRSGALQLTVSRPVALRLLKMSMGQSTPGAPYATHMFLKNCVETS